MLKDWKKTNGMNSHREPLIEYRNKKDKSEFFLEYKSHGKWVLEYIRDKKGFLIDKTFKTKSLATQYAILYMRTH